MYNITNVVEDLWYIKRTLERKKSQDPFILESIEILDKAERFLSYGYRQAQNDEIMNYITDLTMTDEELSMSFGGISND